MVSEDKWLRKYAETMRWAQRFEERLLGLLLAARDYKSAETAAREFDRLLSTDFNSQAGRVLKRLFADRGLLQTATGKVMGRSWNLDSVEAEFKAAIKTRNLLAHYYFRVRFFADEATEALMDELDGLAFVLVFGMKLADILQKQLLPDRTFRANREIMKKEVEHMRRQAREMRHWVLAGERIRKALSEPRDQ